MVEREQRASGARGDTFGFASAAIKYHHTNPSSAGFAGCALRSSAFPSFEDQFTSRMDALALAATNKKAVLDNLVLSNKTLSKLTAKKIARIEELISSRRATPGAAASPADTKLVAQLRAAIKGKWAPGGFCSTHSYGVYADYDSSTCKNKKPMLTRPLVPLLPAMDTTSTSTRVGMLFFLTRPPSYDLGPLVLQMSIKINPPLIYNAILFFLLNRLALVPPLPQVHCLRVLPHPTTDGLL
jgi:hypothetical protein